MSWRWNKEEPVNADIISDPFILTISRGLKATDRPIVLFKLKLGFYSTAMKTIQKTRTRRTNVTWTCGLDTLTWQWEVDIEATGDIKSPVPWHWLKKTEPQLVLNSHLLRQTVIIAVSLSQPQWESSKTIKCLIQHGVWKSNPKEGDSVESCVWKMERWDETFTVRSFSTLIISQTLSQQD